MEKLREWETGKCGLLACLGNETTQNPKSCLELQTEENRGNVAVSRRVPLCSWLTMAPRVDVDASGVCFPVPRDTLSLQTMPVLKKERTDPLVP